MAEMSKKDLKRREYLLAKVWHCVATKSEIKEFEKLDKKFHQKA